MDETEGEVMRKIGLMCLIALILTLAMSLRANRSSPESIVIEQMEYSSTGDAIAEAGKVMQFLQGLEDCNDGNTNKAPTTTTTESTSMPVATEIDNKWDQLAWCETRNNWASNTGNGFGGGLQFAHTDKWSTWISYGGNEFAADPWLATKDEQIAVAERVLADVGWSAWPGCARKIGLI